jgi:hypothetical protein
MVQNMNTNLHIKVQLINHYKNTSLTEELKNTPLNYKDVHTASLHKLQSEC